MAAAAHASSWILRGCPRCSGDLLLDGLERVCLQCGCRRPIDFFKSTRRRDSVSHEPAPLTADLEYTPQASGRRGGLITVRRYGAERLRQLARRGGRPRGSRTKQRHTHGHAGS